jgi:4-hydroxy-3-methylbut-2-en-1-yl diphosphate synthase IspG/GcpE
MRNTKTEFVSCPSCGRTLFDLQETTAAIQQKTGHLPGTHFGWCLVSRIDWERAGSVVCGDSFQPN